MQNTSASKKELVKMHWTLEEVLVGGGLGWVQSYSKPSWQSCIVDLGEFLTGNYFMMSSHINSVSLGWQKARNVRFMIKIDDVASHTLT